MTQCKYYFVYQLQRTWFVQAIYRESKSLPEECCETSWIVPRSCLMHLTDMLGFSMHLSFVFQPKNVLASVISIPLSDKPFIDEWKHWIKKQEKVKCQAKWISRYFTSLFEHKKLWKYKQTNSVVSCLALLSNYISWFLSYSI